MSLERGETTALRDSTSVASSVGQGLHDVRLQPTRRETLGQLPKTRRGRIGIAMFDFGRLLAVGAGYPVH